MTYYRIFQIGNQIFGFRLDFLQTGLFLNNQSRSGFIFYSVFSLKKGKKK